MVLRKVWNDWLHEEGHLSDVDFIDPNKGYHPLFGLGDEKSNVMVIGKSPALTVKKHADTSYERRSVAGPECEWPHSFDHYRHMWLGERVVDKNNRLLPVLRNLVAYFPEFAFEDLYFTNAYKDPVFDTTIEETRDGYDPRALNNEAKKAWRQYLPREIEYVDPNLIVTFGKPATKEAYQALGTSWNSSENITDKSGKISSIDQYIVLSFEHWDYYRRPNSAYGRKDIRDEAHRKRFVEAFKKAEE